MVPRVSDAASEKASRASLQAAMDAKGELARSSSGKVHPSIVHKVVAEPACLQPSVASGFDAVVPMVP